MQAEIQDNAAFLQHERLKIAISGSGDEEVLHAFLMCAFLDIR